MDTEKSARSVTNLLSEDTPNMYTELDVTKFRPTLYYIHNQSECFGKFLFLDILGKCENFVSLLKDIHVLLF
jgi:hypothetical protein